MKVLFIYRHPDMGFSIGKVFKPIEEELKKYCEVNTLYMPVPNYSLMGLWKNIRYACKVVKSGHYDIIHITGAEHYLLPFMHGQRTVVTVHDLGFYTNHKKGIRAFGKYLLWIKTIGLANRVTFISYKSLMESLQFLNLSAGQATVIFNAVGNEYQFKEHFLNTSCPIILQVGTKPNKNLEKTIMALKGLHYYMKIIGPINQQQLELLEKYHVTYSNMINLTNEQVLTEYENCDIVNFPSLYEGFGMPIIEGQAIGRAVVTSNLSPMREIAGEGAVLVNPNNINSIRTGYMNVFDNYEAIVRNGLKNVERFRPSVIAEKYFTVYNELI